MCLLSDCSRLCFFSPLVFFLKTHFIAATQSNHCILTYTQLLPTHCMTDKNTKTDRREPDAAKPAPVNEASELSGSDSELPAPPPFAPGSLPTTPSTAAAELTQSGSQTTSVCCKPTPTLFLVCCTVTTRCLCFFFSLLQTPFWGLELWCTHPMHFICTTVYFLFTGVCFLFHRET